jgi:hypothetical protein
MDAAEPGADVKITIFGDFFPDFGRQKIGVFLKNHVMIPIMQKLAVVWKMLKYIIGNFYLLRSFGNLAAIWYIFPVLVY